MRYLILRILFGKVVAVNYKELSRFLVEIKEYRKSIRDWVLQNMGKDIFKS